MLYLVHQDTSPQKLKKTFGFAQSKRWVYLGRSYLKLLKLKQVLPASSYYSISQALQEAAWALRDPVKQWSAEISKQNQNNIAWWVSSLWERNTVQDPLYLYLCYLEVLKNLVKDQDQNLFVVVENSWLAKAIQENFAHHTTIKTKFFIKPSLKEKTYNLIRLLARWGYGGYQLARSFCAARLTQKNAKAITDSSGPKTLLHTCIDEAAMKEDGSFKDRFFTILPEWLKEQGKDVWILVRPQSFKISLIMAYKWFRRHQQNFLILEDHISIKDYCWAVFQIVRGTHFFKGPYQVNHWKIKSLLSSQFWDQAGNISMVRFVLYYKTIQKLSRQNIRLDKFIDIFENYALEKPLLLAAKHFFPDATTIGYLHAGGQPFNLRYAFNKTEIEYGPYPDYIVTNGPLTHDLLIKEGFAAKRILNGPALRHTHLFQHKTASQSSPQKTVVILCSLSLEDAVELLSKALQCPCLKEKEITTLVKPHPMGDKNKLLQSIGLAALPFNWQWIDGPIDQALTKGRCVLANDGSSVIEAILKQKPTIIISKETRLPQNLLGWLKDQSFEESSHPEQINQKITHFLQMNDDELANYGKKFSDLTSQIFYPVNNDTLNSFLKEKSHDYQKIA